MMLFLYIIESKIANNVANYWKKSNIMLQIMMQTLEKQRKLCYIIIENKAVIKC